ncbi:hypothetical protein [Aeromonas veronii]|uniref:hypothetical protein n=1 Tax=Aeromonas veronii TaxID=654 RepID=UPI001F0AFDC3|nr:hypothetical protein [Aeromonas veronii]
MLAEFRELAPQNGVDAERVIAALGGEPDLSVFGEPAAVEASEQDAALPEQGGPVKSGSEQSEPRAGGGQSNGCRGVWRGATGERSRAERAVADDFAGME